MDVDVKQKIESYPVEVRDMFFEIRGWIFDVAAADDVGVVNETLKWGDPAYLAKKGSSLRSGGTPKNLIGYRSISTVKRR